MSLFQSGLDWGVVSEDLPLNISRVTLLQMLFVACGVHGLDFLGDDFRNYSRIQRYLGRQWIRVGFSLRGVWKNFSFFLRSGGLWETT